MSNENIDSVSYKKFLEQQQKAEERKELARAMKGFRADSTNKVLLKVANHMSANSISFDLNKIKRQGTSYILAYARENKKLDLSTKELDSLSMTDRQFYSEYHKQ